jgi:hypothetical protein
MIENDSKEERKLIREGLFVHWSKNEEAVKSEHNRARMVIGDLIKRRDEGKLASSSFY